MTRKTMQKLLVMKTLKPGRRSLFKHKMAGEAEGSLYDATKRGDMTTFQDVLQEYPYLLDGASFAYSRNLLHIATIWEQVAIVEDLLRRNPKLAEDLDSNNSSPLHIAAAKGNLQIATILVQAALKMCWSLDCQGMNPIHIAATNGHVEVLEHLLQLNYFPAMERVHRGQTVLHLCVKHDQLSVLQVLVEKYLGDVICAQDDDGETILHWAIRFNQLETVRYLVKRTNIDVLARNSVGYSPLDVIAKLPSNHTTSEIKKILRTSKQVLVNDITLNNRMKDSMMIIVALIATVAYQSIVTPPGGVWQDDSPTHKAGEAVMASTRPHIYRAFIAFNTVAFVMSLLVMSMMMMMDFSLLLPIFSMIPRYGFTTALMCAGVSYGASLMVILPNPVTAKIDNVFVACFIVMLLYLAILSLSRLCEKNRY